MISRADEIDESMRDVEFACDRVGLLADTSVDNAETDVLEICLKGEDRPLFVAVGLPRGYRLVEPVEGSVSNFQNTRPDQFYENVHTCLTKNSARYRELFEGALQAKLTALVSTGSAS